MANLERRFAKIPRRRHPEKSRAILEGRSDFQHGDSVRFYRQAREDNRQARSKSAAIRRAESASPRRAPQDRAPAQMLRKPALPVEETNARRFRRKARALVRV